MGVRLNKVLSELNIGLQTAVDFLKNKKELGEVKDEMTPNTKISDEQYQALVDEFDGDKAVKTQAEMMFTKKVKEKKAEKAEKAVTKTEELMEQRTHLKTLGKINLDEKNVEQFVFERKNGLWTLTNIRRGAMYQNANASFLDFYERFSRDSLFQVASLAQPVKTSLPDPDDDFSYIDGEFYPEQWTDFKPPVMPQHMIYNILYGQEYKQSNKKLFIIRGIANGLETEMTFQMKGGEWKLTQLSN